jgi:hypothetical protein
MIRLLLLLVFVDIVFCHVVLIHPAARTSDSGLKQPVSGQQIRERHSVFNIILFSILVEGRDFFKMVIQSLNFLPANK